MAGGKMKWGGVGLAAALFGGAAVLSWLVMPPIGEAQEAERLERRIEAAPDGSVRFSYAAREGVCVDGHRMSPGGDREGRDGWHCEPGPILLEIQKAGSRVEDLDWWVGSQRSSKGEARTDLGHVDSGEAARYLLAVARYVDGDVGEDAIGAASLAADVVIWPDLLEIARDAGVETDTRESAIFWLAQLAGDRATEGLEAIVRSDDETEVKEAALFGLSQLPDGAGFDALMEVAREGDDPELVQASLFWLGQTGDPRAIALFEEILTRD